MGKVAELHDLSLADLPRAPERRIAIHVHAAAERALRQGHPWLFETGIREQSHEGAAGDLAVCFDRKGRFLAVGFYDPFSPIRVRILRAGSPEPIDVGAFERRIEAALTLRRSILHDPATNGFRLLHGESDGMPGLVADRYADLVVMKLYTLAWLPHLADVIEALRQRAPFRHLLFRLGRTLRSHPDALHGLREGAILSDRPRGRDDHASGAGMKIPVLFQENGLTFEVDPVRGQKTGFFLDQRENRMRVEALAPEADSVLNVFAYTGGFSLYAARGGAQRVVSLDSSRPALEAAERNFASNRGVASIAKCRHEIRCGDAFSLLRRSKEEAFGMVILDPPSFAKEAAEVRGALTSYTRLARLALGALRPGGILVSASCSSRVDAETFFGTVHRAAELEGRALSEVERTGHPVDHPLVPHFPEGAYLKCLFARAA